jgi:hypothetical protein
MLTALTGSPFAFQGAPITTDPQGSYLYASGPSGMVTLKIDATTGGLTQVGSPVPFGGAMVLTYVQ